MLLATLGLAAQQQLGPKPAKGQADRTENEGVARIAADGHQEEQQAAEHERGERLDAQVVGRGPAVRIASQRQLALDGFHALDLRVGGLLRACLLEAIERFGQLTDERPQHALGKWLLKLDLLEAARALVERGEALGNDVLAGPRQIQTGNDQAGAGRREKSEQHDELS